MSTRQSRVRPLPTGPVAVGGLGGSGTRVVATILREAGLVLGPDLNHALDDLWFALLFQRPSWYFRSDPDERRKLLGLYEEALHGRMRPTPANATRIVRAAADISLRGLDQTGYGRGIWPWHRVRYLWRYGTGWGTASHAVSPRQAWGWKEPNTHVFLPDLARTFGAGVRYVHVIRHGLDMAFSGNRAQLFNWGSLYGVPVDGSTPPDELPRLQLRYWVRANRRAIARGRRLLGSRFYRLSFDDLCRDPGQEIADLIRWLGLRAEPSELERLSSLVNPPPTRGRYQDRGLERLAEEDVIAVEELGFQLAG